MSDYRKSVCDYNAGLEEIIIPSIIHNMKKQDIEKNLKSFLESFLESFIKKGKDFFEKIKKITVEHKAWIYYYYYQEGQKQIIADLLQCLKKMSDESQHHMPKEGKWKSITHMPKEGKWKSITHMPKEGN